MTNYVFTHLGCSPGNWVLGDEGDKGTRKITIPNHQSPITNHQSPITNPQSPIPNPQSPIPQYH
ncbi:MAG: hypothetical protein V7L23_36730 [Nostoc sp.]|uniref:hypothetical protein n=1 Tax=Nostoc sp. TaxID=1180 RepID=UPI002FEFCF81